MISNHLISHNLNQILKLFNTLQLIQLITLIIIVEKDSNQFQLNPKTSQFNQNQLNSKKNNHNKSKN
jgi:hypothetical protein